MRHTLKYIDDSTYWWMTHFKSDKLQFFPLYTIRMIVL